VRAFLHEIDRQKTKCDNWVGKTFNAYTGKHSKTHF